MVQFGDVEYKDGDGGVSSFKKKYFADENFDVGTQPRGPYDETSCPERSSSQLVLRMGQVILGRPTEP